MIKRQPSALHFTMLQLSTSLLPLLPACLTCSPEGTSILKELVQVRAQGLGFTPPTLLPLLLCSLSHTHSSGRCSRLTCYDVFT